MTARPDIRSLGRAELAERLRAWRQSEYRLGQLLDWLYVKAAADWSEMTNLPLALRARLAEEYALGLPGLVRLQGSGDSTHKFLWRLADGALIESVLIPANPALYGDPSDRHTLCLSTQVGCAYGCRFCASGLDGWKRNLTRDEMVGQVLAVERWHRERLPTGPGAVIAAGPTSDRVINNLVIMGMGEPLANYDALMQALETVNASWGLAIGARKITISTSGLVPEIRRLAAEPRQYGLAISLHGATDEVRGRLMPVNRKYPLRMLLEACREYIRVKGRTLTFEYILIAGVNDDLAQARRLAVLARDSRAKINLIPYNRVAGLDWDRPSAARQEAFLSALLAAGGRATLRREKGHEIDAACGQLRLRTEREATVGGVRR